MHSFQPSAKVAEVGNGLANASSFWEFRSVPDLIGKVV